MNRENKIMKTKKKLASVPSFMAISASYELLDLSPMAQYPAGSPYEYKILFSHV